MAAGSHMPEVTTAISCQSRMSPRATDGRGCMVL